MDHEATNGNRPSDTIRRRSVFSSAAASVHLYREFNFGAGLADPRDVGREDGPDTPPSREAEPTRGSLFSGPGDEISATPGSFFGRTRLPEVPGYELLSELGRGGMGVVYKARELKLNRLVALKMILAGDHASADALSRLLVEAETIARLQHPNIVQVYAIGDCDGRPYVALEFVGGGSLASKLDGTPWPPRAAARLTETLAHAVSAAHRLEIVHRDLKPGNILMTEAGEPKVSDFGLAKQLEQDGGLTRSESILGSPSYMAPEQAEGRAKDVGPAADIYALGANLYELLTGRPPFVGPSIMATLELVRHTDPVPPRRLQPDVERDLETICLKCLEKEPSKRYESADALAQDVALYLDNKPIHARPTSSFERAVKWVRRRPSTAALVLVTALAVGGTSTGLLLHRTEVARQAQALTRRIQSLQAQADHFVLLGQEAIRRHDWENARTQASSALALIRSEPRLARTRLAVEKMLTLCADKIAAQKDRELARQRLASLIQLYDEAVFHQSEYTGLDPAANLLASRSAAQRGLDLFRDPSGEIAIGREDKQHFSAAELETITSTCYELATFYADAVSKPLAEEDPNAQARQALMVLDEARRLHAPTATFHAHRADYLERLGDREAAAAERRDAEQVAGKNNLPDDAFLAGELAFRKHEFKRAADEFRHALLLKPDHFWAQYLLAICHLKLHRASEAQASLIACQGQRPGFVWTYLLKGFAEGEMGDFDLAEADFERASELGLTEQGRYVMLVNRGVMRIRRGQYSAATADLKAAIAIKPDQFQAYINLAQSYDNMKCSADALEVLDQAIGRTKAQPELFRARSRLYRHGAEHALALVDLDQAIALAPAGDPALVGDYLERGLILQAEGRAQEALEACDKALALRPDLPDLHRLRAVVLVQLKRYDEAVRSFDICLTRGKASPALFEARGLALAWSGAFSRAIADYTIALNTGKPTANLFGSRGWAYLSTGASELALKDFDKALQLDPSSGHVLAGRALAYVQTRKPREAAADARAAAQASPDDARQLYGAARVLCLAAACLEAEPNGSANAWNIAREYRAEALEMLTRALQQVPRADRARFWRDVVRTDGALEPIRRARVYLDLEARAGALRSDPSEGGSSNR